MRVPLEGIRAFITGGAGFVGSHLADQLLEAGAERVVILDNLVRGRRANLADAMATGRVDLVVGDLRDADLVDRLTAGCDVVFHQAALRITHCAAEPVLAVEVMVNGMQNVLESAVRHRVKKVVAASSASVYGEPIYLPMDESHPFNNRTLYGGLKIANEQMLRAYAEMHRLSYVVLRPFNIYGPRMDIHGAYTEVMIRWMDRLAEGKRPIIFGDGTQTMDFVYVEDVARAYLLAATADVTDVALNVGSGIETSLSDLCRLVARASGHGDVEPLFEPPRKVNPVSRRQASTERARRMIGFASRTGLDEGLGSLIAWHAATAHQGKEVLQ